MIVSFADTTTADIYHGSNSKAARKLPRELWARMQIKLDLLNACTSIADLQVPPANRLEKLKGANEDETTGIAIVKRAIEEPLRQIVVNSGIEGSIVVQKVKEGKADFGFNARTEVYENLLKAGVIDPTKVTRIALENAASIAGMLLTTECVIADKPKKEEAHAHPGGAPGMGGMDY